MRIVFDKSIFTLDDPYSVQDLVAIVNNTRHSIFFDDTTTEYLNWKNLNQVYATRLNAIILSTAKLINGGGLTKTIVVHAANSDWNHVPRLSVADAKIFVNIPFKIFVENNTADREFLLSYMSSEDSEYFVSLEARSWLQFTHGGGTGDLLKQIENEVNKFNGAHLRSFSYFDNDGWKVGAPSDKTEAIRKYCEKNQVPHHQLLRRSIENYVHFHAISEYSNNHSKRKAGFYRRALTSFRKLSEDHRDFFNMKAGLKGDAKQGNVFDYPVLDFMDKRYLGLGFGKNLSSVFTYENFSQKKTSYEFIRAATEVGAVVLKIKECL